MNSEQLMLFWIFWKTNYKDNLISNKANSSNQGSNFRCWNTLFVIKHCCSKSSTLSWKREMYDFKEYWSLHKTNQILLSNLSREISIKFHPKGQLHPSNLIFTPTLFHGRNMTLNKILVRTDLLLQDHCCGSKVFPPY